MKLTSQHFLIVIGLAFLAVLACASPAAADVTPRVGLHISSSQGLRPGNYFLADAGGVIQLSGSHFTLDCRGTTMIGPGGKGICLKLTDASDVTIRGADISGYQWGVVLERCTRVRLIQCTSSRNADLPPGTVIDESGTEPEDTHGGGFVLRDCKDCLLQRCTAQHQWDGIDVVRSTGTIIEDGDYSYNGNWGLHLWTSSHNIFRRNRAIWCTTGSGLLYQSLGGWQTYDSQAVGIDHNSCDNTIEENDLRFGGDAIFIRANEGGQTPGHPVPVKNGSNRNRLLNNDCSFSPNNAIEVDFVEDTVIEGNNCSNSNYGMWLGYSVRSICRNNICVNDSTHAVEIENGQNGVFERNVFGWDQARRNGQLVFLRQNGSDKTPSGPYTIKKNLFYGAGTGVQLVNTPATLVGNYDAQLGKSQERSSVLVVADSKSKVEEAGTVSVAPDNAGADTQTGVVSGISVVPGASVTIHADAKSDEPPPVVELAGVPMWIRATRRSSVSVWLPTDTWIYTPVRTIELTVRTAHRGRSYYGDLNIEWGTAAGMIVLVSPNPARIGENITVTGRNLHGGHFLLNGKVADVVSESDDTTVLKAPEGILASTHFNLVWEKGQGAQRIATWPVVVSVNVPNEQMPHLVTAGFSPGTVKVGELLKVTMTVRNNLPAPALLTTLPTPPFTYGEKQAWYEMGLGETPGHLNLRVSTDFFVGGHNPGSWPWMFGFDKPQLKPGESTTVVGYVRLQTPGTHVFRIGLVAGGGRFIDDNAFQTKITVVP